MPQLDPTYFSSQLFWLALCFGIFYLLMSKVAIPAISSVLERRQDRINGDLMRAEDLKKELKNAIASYDQAIADARQKAQAIVGEVHENMKAEMEKEQQAVEAQIATKTAEAEARVAQARQAALAELSGIATDVSSDILQKFSGTAPDAGKLNQIIEKAVADHTPQA